MTFCFESQFGSQFHTCRPAQPANQLKISKWANSANFYPIEFKLGTEVINNLPDGNSMFEVAAIIFRPTSPSNQNRPKVKTFNFRVFHPIWMKFGMGANKGAKTTQNETKMPATIFRPTSLTNQNRPKMKISNFCVFCPI